MTLAGAGTPVCPQSGRERQRAGSSAHDMPASALIGTAADQGRCLTRVTTVLCRSSGVCW